MASECIMAANKAQSSLQVVFLIDITGSMSNQIEGVKQMVAKFCEIDRPLIDVHIWTFTESPGCHVTQSPVGLKSAELVKYTQSIILSQPPGKPGITAGGGDGPENVTAGIASLVEFFDINQNLLVFIITDAPPHHKCFGQGHEMKEEKKWLEEAGFEDTDVFIVLCQVIDSLNLTFVPVLYGDAINKVWFHQAAAMTEGLVLCPKEATSEVLAGGLGVFLDTFQKLSVSRDLSLLKNLNSEDLSKGFNILDINPEEFKMIEEDPGNNSQITKDCSFVGGGEVLADKIAAPFKTALDRFSGKKAATRCRDISGEHIAASVKVLIRGMLYSVKSSLFDGDVFQRNLEELKVSLESLSEKDSKYKWEISVLNKFKTAIESQIPSFENKLQLPDGNPIPELLLLESICSKLDTLNQKPISELDVSNWMDQVLQLIKCKFLNINFPPSASGRLPDFSDAWSASIGNIELSTTEQVSIALATKKDARDSYTSPITSQKYNSLLIYTSASEFFLSQFYYFLTFFPTLQGLIQSYLISSTYKVFPSITLGLQASSLWFILRAKTDGAIFTEFEWEFTRNLAHTFKTSQLKPAAPIFKACNKGTALNPVDNCGKIFSAILSFYRKKRVDLEKSSILLRLFFEEYSVENILYEAKKGDSNLPTNEEILKIFTEHENIEGFDPLNGVHSIEKICKNNENIGDEFLLKIKAKVFNSKALKNSINVFRTACGLLVGDLFSENSKEVYNSEEVKTLNGLLPDELLSEIFFESFILQKRTARYSLDESSKEWKRPSLDRIPASTIQKHLLDLLKEAFRTKLNEWNEKRKVNCQSNLVNIVSSLPDGTFEDFNTQLSEISYTTQNLTLKLTRSDAIDCLNRISPDQVNYEHRLSTLGLALILGNWSAAPVSELRKYSKQIFSKFSFSGEICERIKLSFSLSNDCNRTEEKPNRHGHHKENKYPGTFGWSAEYEEALKKSKKKKLKKLGLHLKELKDYTEFYNEVLHQVLESEDYTLNQKKMVKWCIEANEDVRVLNKIKGFVERIKKVKLINEENFNWDQKIADAVKVIVKGKSLWKRLDSLLIEAEKVNS